jgi:hypothetical protein
MSDQIKDFINKVAAGDYNDANEMFGSMMADRIDTAIEQEKVNVAGSIFNDDVNDETDLEEEDEEVNESRDREPSGKVVAKMNIKGSKVQINKEVSGFVVYIDGDRLDSYKSESEAKSAAKEFINNAD